jgi:hypothetical protein
MKVLAGVVALVLCSNVKAAAESPINSAPVLARNQQSDEGGYIVRYCCYNGASFCCIAYAKRPLWKHCTLLAAALVATRAKRNLKS